MDEADEVRDYTGVGRHLRAAREAVGQQIADAAKALRIAAYHLEALESGRYTDLPEAVYVHGFVRSYAGYLKLDPDEMVRRVRLELLPAIIPDDLHFPAAPQDSPKPSRNLLLLALILAVAVIGFWYFSMRFETTPEPAATELPPQLQTDQPAIPPPAPEAAASPEPAPELAAEAPEIPPVDELVSQNPAVAPPNMEAAPKAAEDASPSKGSDAILAEEIGTPEITSKAALATLDPPDMPAGAAALEPSPPLKAEPASEAAAPVPLEALAKAPVVLRASSDTWMQVSNANGAVVKSWIMRAGEQYVPPADQAGLKVMIGNAGALSVFVDGVEFPPLGAQGAVIRDLPLDAAGLKTRFNR
ncbi:MAG: helix-turn-helix domain-containing protein [Pseudomonadota bacterium]